MHGRRQRAQEGGRGRRLDRFRGGHLCVHRTMLVKQEENKFRGKKRIRNFETKIADRAWLLACFTHPPNHATLITLTLPTDPLPPSLLPHSHLTPHHPALNRASQHLMEHMAEVQRRQLEAFAERVRALELGPRGRRRTVHGRTARVA